MWDKGFHDAAGMCRGERRGDMKGLTWYWVKK